MRYLLIILIPVFFYSCNFDAAVSEKENAVTGNWLIVYPDHSLLDTTQLKGYGPMQDSLVNRYGLRLIQTKSDGSFSEPDSFYTSPGSWLLFDDRQLVIKGNSEDFKLYICTFRSYINSRLEVLKKQPSGNDSLPILWVWKKIRDNNPASILFEPAQNEWRKKPGMHETDAAIKTRVADMLKYYSVYFEMVAQESSYFSPTRVPLPFRYFAHGIGLQPFDDKGKFAVYFFDTADAKKAYQVLNQTIKALKDKYPKSDNYVTEYAEYFKLLSAALE